jgi:DNA primase
LEFSLSHHRFLWQQIFQLKMEQVDLISNLQDRYLESAEELSSISHLFHLSEKTHKDILRTPQVIQAAIACIELAMREKRSRYFQELWEQTDQDAEPERSKHYAEALYAEKRRCLELNKQRNFSIEEVLRFSI